MKLLWWIKHIKINAKHGLSNLSSSKHVAEFCVSSSRFALFKTNSLLFRYTFSSHSAGAVAQLKAKDRVE